MLLVSFNTIADELVIKKTKEEYTDLLSKKYSLIPHKGTYLLPFLYTEFPNNDVYKPFSDDLKDGDNRGKFNKHLEAEMQVSFLILLNEKLLNSNFDLFFGFTQRSWWQVYNDSWSRPFRETNYEPEVFVRNVLDSPYILPFGAKLLLYDIGIAHQSNGQIQELSRSWNRVFIRMGLMLGDLGARISLWQRIPEKRTLDDNPDVYKYLGYGEIDFAYTKENFQSKLRIIPGIEKQGAELSLSLPWKEGLRFYTKMGYGYGLSLIDYNYNNSKIGFGFTLTDPLIEAKQSK